MARFERELAFCSELNDQKGVATALRGCGFTAILYSDLSRTQECDDKALALSMRMDDTWGIAWALYDLGYLAPVRGALTQARNLLEEALPQLRHQSISFGKYRALHAIGHVMRTVGQWEVERQYYCAANIVPTMARL